MSDFITLKTQIQALSYKPLLAEDVKSLIKIDRDLFEKSKQQLKFNKKKSRTASGTNKNGGEGAGNAADDEFKQSTVHVLDLENTLLYDDAEIVSADGIFSVIVQNPYLKVYKTELGKPHKFYEYLEGGKINGVAVDWSVLIPSEIAADD